MTINSEGGRPGAASASSRPHTAPSTPQSSPVPPCATQEGVKRCETELILAICFAARNPRLIPLQDRQASDFIGVYDVSCQRQLPFNAAAIAHHNSFAPPRSMSICINVGTCTSRLLLTMFLTTDAGRSTPLPAAIWYPQAAAAEPESAYEISLIWRRHMAPAGGWYWPFRSTRRPAAQTDGCLQSTYATPQRQQFAADSGRRHSNRSSP